MRINTNLSSILLFFMIQFMLLPNAYGKKMVRWEDGMGNIFYSDLVPPKHVKHRRETLNGDARVIKITEAKKTQEQLELEARLFALRKEQEKIIAKQKSYDKVLLSTFRNLDDMQLTLQGKLKGFKAQRKVSQNNLNRLEKKLATLQKQAAQIERNGKKVSKKLIKGINKADEKIQLAFIDIGNNIKKQQQYRKDFEADIERFKFLTISNANAQKASDKSASIIAADALGLFSCSSAAECAKAWNIARKFVDSHSTTQIEVDTEKLILGSVPLSDNDLSLSVSKMPRKNKPAEIFLDIRCRNSSLGKELCKSHRARKIRTSFRPFIQSAL